MKAVFIRRFGSPDVLEFGDQPEPVIGTGEVLVDVVAASVNAADWQVRSGDYTGPITFPHILGRDFSGTISRVDAAVTDLRVGDAVFGVCDVGREGAYAEQIAISGAIVAKKPAGLSHQEAASLALAGITALSALYDTLGLRPGETILIQGGAGGVGGFAIQAAKDLGAHVVTTARLANHDYLRALGADEVIDYSTVDFTSVLRECDAVFDTVGGEVAERCFAVLKPGGRAAFIASGPHAPKPERDDVISLRPSVGRSRKALERVIALYDKGAVSPPEIVGYSLSDAAEAHRVSQSRHFRGKLILNVSEGSKPTA